MVNRASKPRVARLALPLFVVALPSVTQAQTTYNYTNVANIAAASTGSTLTQSRTYAINSSGTLVGDYTTSSGATNYFTLAPGSGTITPFPSQLSYFATAPNAGHQINDSGNYVATNGTSSVDGTGIGGTYSPASATFTQFPTDTTYQTSNQIATGFQPYAINSSNNVVGQQYFETNPTSQYPSSNYHGVIYNSATNTTTDIGGTVPGSGGDATTGASLLDGISDNNYVVGSASVPISGHPRTDAILGVPGGSGGETITDLSTLISSAATTAGYTYVSSNATNISANGKYIVGTYRGSLNGTTYLRGFKIANDATAIDLGTLPGATNSTQLYATAVDDAGDVVGYSSISSGSTFHGFIYFAGATSPTDVNSLVNAPNTVFSAITGINDVGDLVGYDNANLAGGTQYSAFLLTPTPEPGSLMFCGVTVAGVVLSRRRTKKSSFQQKSLLTPSSVNRSI